MTGQVCFVQLEIDHLTVVRFIVCPLNDSEAGVDLVLIETSLPSYVNDVVLMQISRDLRT